jgi:hypothetical protein
MKCLPILLILTISGSAYPQKKTRNTCDSYIKTILKEQISLEPGDNEDKDFYSFPFYVSGLHMQGGFKRIYFSPLNYYSCYNAIINNDTLNHRYKHYAFLAMQNLRFPEYLTVLEQTYQAYEKGKINIATLDQAVYQYEWPRSVLNNRKNPKLRALLKRMLVNEQLPPQLKGRISDILCK